MIRRTDHKAERRFHPHPSTAPSSQLFLLLPPSFHLIQQNKLSLPLSILLHPLFTSYYRTPCHVSIGDRRLSGGQGSFELKLLGKSLWVTLISIVRSKLTQTPLSVEYGKKLKFDQNHPKSHVGSILSADGGGDQVILVKNGNIW